MKKPTSATRRKIAKDWISHLPGMVAWKPFHLLRRHGPVVVGVCLDRSRQQDEYVPRFHFHNLARDFPAISLALYGGLPARHPGDREIPFRDHDGTISKAADELLRRYPFLSKVNDLSFGDFVRRSADYLKKAPAPFELYPFEDVVLVAAALGLEDYAREALSDFYAFVRTWRPQAFEGGPRDPEAWRNDLAARLSQERLQETIAQQVTEHKLDTLPDHGLLADASPPQLARLVNLWKTSSGKLSK